MKEISCKKCGKRFVVAELGKQKVSYAEAEGLCGTCWWKKHDIYDFKKLVRTGVIEIR